MASYYVGINRGASLTGCSIGSSTTGKDVELVINNATIPSKNDALVLMKHLEAYITQLGWPPM